MIYLLGGSFGAALFIASGVVFFKKATLRASSTWEVGREIIPSLLALVGKLDFWIGLLAYCVAFGIMLACLPHVKVHQFYPLSMMFNLLLIVIVGFLFLGESVPYYRVVGLFFVVIGGYLVCR